MSGTPFTAIYPTSTGVDPVTGEPVTITAPGTPWAAKVRYVAAAAGATDIKVPTDSSDTLDLRQLRVSTTAAAEVVVYWSADSSTPASAAAIPPANIVFGASFGANGGASPDMSFEGSQAPSPGMRLRVFTSAAATVYVGAEGKALAG